MMRTIIKMFITAAVVLFLAELLPGITVKSYTSAIWVAIALAFLRIFVRPLIIILTLPITIFTLGLFLFVINACIILLADKMIDGFAVDGFWWALFFSLLLSGIQSSVFAYLKDRKQNER